MSVNIFKSSKKSARRKTRRDHKVRNIILTVVAASYFIYQIYLIVRVFWVK
ncbi:MAG TPA: hypothetical protein VGS28_04935 [Candidatus Saccharimonadales bacterium]|nr:hypothetical protein [Candidatus Saccharimonadales bacterium]